MPPSGVYVIAEAGSCHDGDLEKALRLIYVASQAGCSAVKFQFWSSPERMAERRNAGDKLWAFRKHQLPSEWLAILQAAAKKRDLDYLCTCYLPEDLPVIAPLVSRLKVSSFEATDNSFVMANLETGKPVIISTGMMGRAEIEHLRELRTKHGRGSVSLLHCVTSYPAPLGAMNLRAIRAHGLDGFSDHSGHELMGALAVVAGASIVEVHFRDDRTAPDNPDLPHSHTPRTLAAYVNNIRIAEAALGFGHREADNPYEKAMKSFQVRA